MLSSFPTLFSLSLFPLLLSFSPLLLSFLPSLSLLLFLSLLLLLSFSSAGGVGLFFSTIFIFVSLSSVLISSFPSDATKPLTFIVVSPTFAFSFTFNEIEIISFSRLPVLCIATNALFSSLYCKLVAVKPKENDTFVDYKKERNHAD